MHKSLLSDQKIMRLIVCAGIFFLAFPFTETCWAQNNFGNWFSGKMDDNEGYFAASVNDSREVFGQYCFNESGKCVWLLLADVDCEEGSKYHALVNADGGSEHLEILCNKIGSKPRYIFTNFEKIDTVVSGSTSYIGIAFPLASGLFQVTRFLLDGSKEALQDMESKMKSRNKTKNSKKTNSYKM